MLQFLHDALAGANTFITDSRHAPAPCR